MRKKVSFIIALLLAFSFFCPKIRAEEESSYEKYIENFDSGEYSFESYWNEVNAFGDLITAERIVEDPKNSGNNVYELNWDPLGSGVQLLKWPIPLKEYKLSVDLMGGKERPQFTGERSFPAGVFLRTTVDKFGKPEYENVGGEINFGTSGVFVSLNDSWVSVDVKTSDSAHYKDVNKGTDGTWMYFNGKGNNCYSNFTNLNVIDDGNVMKITWNNELLCTIEMSEIETVELGDVVADFYTKAVIKNADGEVKSTITDARIAAGEYASIAFTVRATKLYVDNLSLEYIEAESSGAPKTPTITNTPSSTEETDENTPEPTPTQTEEVKTTPNENDPQNKGKSNNTTFIVIGIVLGVVTIAVVVFIVIMVSKRKREENT